MTQEELELAKLALEKWKIGLTLGSSLLGTAVVIGLAFLGYQKGFKNWLKQKKQERKMAVSDSEIAALKAVWSLLAYYPVRPNSKAFILKEDEKGKPKQYFLVPEKAVVFVNEVAKVFFEEGHGIFLNKATKDALFTLRNGALTLLKEQETQKKQEEQEKIVPIKAAALRKEMNAARDSLVEQLRKEVMAC